MTHNRVQSVYVAEDEKITSKDLLELRDKLPRFSWWKRILVGLGIKSNAELEWKMAEDLLIKSDNGYEIVNGKLVVRESSEGETK